MILVITKPGDKHGAHMISVLKKIGERVSAFIFSDFPTINELSFGPNSGFSLKLVDGSKINGQEIKSVLYRRCDEPIASASIKSTAIRKYVAEESDLFLETLPQLTDCLWVSGPDAIRVANRKPYQLTVAAKLGFKIPETLITNSPEEGKRFFDTIKSDVVVKTLHTPGFVTENGIQVSLFNRRLGKQGLIPFLARLKNCPVILQPYIEKLFELRITVVGGRVFPCAIYSQSSQRTLDDWRRYDLPNTPHKPFALPPDLEKKCVALVKTLGLKFGCIDMIVTPDKEYVFLEINPNGQWLWIEQLTGLPIAQALAELLIAGKDT